MPPSILHVLCGALCFATAALLPAAPTITEFVASNDTGLQDQDGDYSDWIEIHNPDGTAISLDGFALSDQPDDLTRWEFPTVSLDPGEYLVVFASSKNRTDPAAELHTNFKLSAGGGYLALSGPGGIASEYGPVYPEQYEDFSYGRVNDSGIVRDGFLDAPTPGAANSSGDPAGPVFTDVTDKPARPVAGADLVITAETSAVSAAVGGVTLFYRVMFGGESSLAMADDGVAPDVAAGDGIYTAVISGSDFDDGEMIRWRFWATDELGFETRSPLFRDPLDSHEYVGTVAEDPGVQSLLPVVYQFFENPSGIETDSGTRGAVFYLGELYDNVFMNVHGQSTAGALFDKKSANIDFNKTQRFRWREGEKRVKDMDLLTNFADKSKARHVLAWELMRGAGVHAHEAFTVRVEQNGEFYGTMDFVEDPDDIYLERAGLNPDGALYKMYDIRLETVDIAKLTNDDALDANGDTATRRAAEKKNRREEGREDLRNFISGLHASATNSDAQWSFIYDNVNLPMMVNLAATFSVMRATDLHRKNWYFYRDSGRTDEWAMLPWDLDLSHGRRWNSTDKYFDSGLLTAGVIEHGTAVDLLDIIWDRPEVASMIHRRIRTLADRYLNSNDTPYGLRYYEGRLDEMLATIDPPSITPSDAQLDFEKWGSWIDEGEGATDSNGTTTLVPYTNTHPHVETMVEAVDRWKNEYLPGRRSYIDSNSSIPESQNGTASFTFSTLVPAGAVVRVKVPTDASEDATWMMQGFDDSAWAAGTTGVGFDSSKYLPLIGYDTKSQMRDATPRQSSAYMRIEFDVIDPSIYQALELHMKFDDGYVAYLNGVKVHEQFAPASPAWDSVATSNEEAEVDVYEEFDVTGAGLGQLVAGTNVLAIHGMNQSTTSGDFLIMPELIVGAPDSAGSMEPSITFGALEFNPVSGDQDEEYVELINNNAIWVDVSDWTIRGGIEFDLPPGTVIPPGGSVYLSPDVKTFRARAASPTGGERKLVVGGYSGHLSSFGESLELLDPTGALNASTSYVGQPSDTQQFLVITEIMYHPEPDGEAEFLELMNISESVTLDLTGVTFTEGISFDFAGAGISSLAPGQRLILVKDVVAFEVAHAAGLPVAGTFAMDSSLSNGGESIKLEDPNGGTIKEFSYNDKAPWPTSPDTGGFSLVLIDPETNPAPSLSENWRASFVVGGSPGSDDRKVFTGDPLADADGDGLTALIEYAAGTSDSETNGSVTSPGVVEVGGLNYATFAYRSDPSATDVRVSIETSTDLAVWVDGAADIVETDSVPNPDGTATVLLRFSTVVGGEVRHYYRLKAQLN